MNTEDINKMAQILKDMKFAEQPEIQQEPVAISEKLSPKQKELDVDKDGDIEGDDLADLRKGKHKQEARQLKDKNKETMVVKNNKVIVIDKGQLKNYLAKGYTTAESANESTETDIAEVEVAEEMATVGRFHMESIRKGIQSMWEAAASKKVDPKTVDTIDKQLERSAGEKAFVDAHKSAPVVDGEKIEGDSITKALDQNKEAPKRKGDNKQGDKKIINPVDDITATKVKKTEA
jgi:hypothetical protein|tara:strand:- start:2066 stop:2767 length:702 start_codon:yes stop_codon:yes gene_type:complete